jgi:hypothetical protein
MCHRKGHLDSIGQIRQMMAEHKFFEAQKKIELELQLNPETRHELLLLYFDVLISQHKIYPLELTIELAEKEAEKRNFDFALSLISEMKSEKHRLRVIKLKISALEDKGLLDELYSLVSDFLLRQFEKQVPVVPVWIETIIEKYFKQDFHLKLKKLALALLQNDLDKSEEFVKQLITNTVEKSSPKGISEKLLAVGEVLKSGHNKSQLEIYQNFCFIAVEGINDKSDYKRLVEMVIFFDDFKFKVLLLSLMHNLGLEEGAKQYANSVRASKDYSFIYFDKFFPHLKGHFVQPSARNDKIEEKIPSPDLRLTERYVSNVHTEEDISEQNEDELKFFHLLKYQSYTHGQFCDLAVSFLQSEMPRVALRASELALKTAANDYEILKASYMKLTCELKLQDYRAAVDTCFIALTNAVSKDDILSFMYGQAEAYMRLNQKNSAKAVLSKIISIDAKYRLAKERLEELNEL